jgi:hypothetical protein
VCSSDLSKSFRLATLFEEVRRAPRPTSFDEAWCLLDRTLRAIEDRYTSLTYDPSQYSTARRMYVPSLDNDTIWRRHGNWWYAELFAHELRISDYGHIQVIDKQSGLPVFEK